MTWRELISGILEQVNELDEPVEILLHAQSEDDVWAKHVTFDLAPRCGACIKVETHIPLFDATYLESERQAGRSEVEREYEKAANDKAERETIEDLHCWLGKQIGV